MARVTEVTANLAGRRPSSTRRRSRLGIVRGDFIDRYVVLEEIGAGGMGVVFKALDPELERRVAIKLLSQGTGDRNTAGRARLVREGRAIAQLAHPNVVAVYDVGVFRDDLFFVAMEHVEGRSLRQWLKDETRPQPEIVDKFIQAGRGLAAAHAKGLIHRDFKPDNVLVGDDGRVRVVDFGLARFDAESTSDKTPDAAATKTAQVDDASSLSSSLTRTGDIMGTPAFMAPEQYRGEVGDARTDQFAFCVTLYQALCGCRPFNATSVDADSVPETPRPIPHSAHVPGWLDQLVMRGLSAEPDDRHASMAGLLEELERDRGLKRNTVVLSAVAVVSIILIALVVFLASMKERKCKGGEARFGAVWSDDARRRVKQAFVKTQRPYATEAFARVSTAFDAYGTAWKYMYIEACEATHVHRTQSDKILDLRMACLDRRLSELDALVGVFSSEMNAAQLNKAVQAAYGLTPVDSCADRDSLEAIIPPPTKPQVRARVAALRKQLDQSYALQNTGKYAKALAVAKVVAAEASGVGYAPLEAESLFRLGSLQQRNGDPKAAEKTLYKAMKLAAAGRDHVLVTHVLTELVWVVGYMQSRHGEGHAFFQAAIATAGYGKASLLSRVHMLKNIGVVLNSQGRYADALPYHQKVLTMLEAKYGGKHPYVATALNNVGTVFAMQGKSAQASDYFQRALVIGEKTLGRDHPYVTDYLNNIGEMLSDQGKYDEARTYLTRALVALKRTLGKQHPDLAYVLDNLGNGYAEQDKCTDALKHYKAAIGVREAALGKDHPFIAFPLTGAGRCYVDLKRFGEAIKTLERALRILKASAGDPNPMAKAKFLLAQALWAASSNRNARARARKLAAAARTVWTKAKSSKWKPWLQKVQAWLQKRLPSP